MCGSALARGAPASDAACARGGCALAEGVRGALATQFVVCGTEGGCGGGGSAEAAPAQGEGAQGAGGTQGGGCRRAAGRLRSAHPDRLLAFLVFGLRRSRHAHMFPYLGSPPL
eukprot:1143134-Rhodomonas_salina.1